MDQEYLSIKQFAEAAGVSPQAIYQRLDKDFKPYFKVIKGRKSLNREALSLFHGNSFKAVDQPIDKQFKEPLKQVESHNPDNTAIHEVEALKQLTSTLNNTLKVLESQLLIKDAQITALNDQNKALNEHLRQSQQLNENNQILLARQQEPPPQIEEPTRKIKRWWEKLFTKE